MARPRKPENAKLPEYVYYRKGRYVYHPPRSGERPLRYHGKLIRRDEPVRKVWAAVDAIEGVPRDTVAWLLDCYLVSRRFRSLAPSTRKGYEWIAQTLKNYQLPNGQTFGEQPYLKLRPFNIRQYMDWQEDRPTQANREIQFLKSVYGWAIEYNLASFNPCVGVKLYPTRVRQRYVTDAEYLKVLRVARRSKAPWMVAAMEVAYICRARRHEVVRLTRDDILPEGLFIRRGKGSLDEITTWTPRLKWAVSFCERFSGKIPQNLIHDADGKEISPERLSQAFVRICGKALDDPFPFHDIKAKGVSDHKRRHSGHKSARMRHVYDRKAEEIPGTV